MGTVATARGRLRLPQARPGAPRRRWRVAFLLATLPLAPIAGAEGLLPADVERLRGATWFRVEMVAFARGDAGASPRRLTGGFRLPWDATMLGGPAPPAAAAGGCRRLAAAPAPLPEAGQGLPPWLRPLPHPDCAGTGADDRPAPPGWPAVPAPVFGSDFSAAAVHACYEVDRRVRYPRPDAGPVDDAEIERLRVREDARRHYESLRLATLSRHSAEELDGVRRAVARRFTVLGADAWIQRATPRASPQPLLVQLGARDGAGRYALEGWVSVTAARFAHFEAHLLRTLPGGEAALMRQSRRMRSGELHYLDHPAFGLVVQLERLEEPEALRRAIDELAEHPR